MQCARRELDVLRPAPAGFYHRLRIVGSIVVLVHGGSLLADHACGQGDDAYRSGSAGGAPGELLPSASGINLHRRSYCTKGQYHFGDRGATIRLPTDCRYCWRQARERRPSRTRPGRGDRIAISAYLGKSDAFDRAIASFAETYADQNERDFAARVQMEPAAVVASPSAAKR